MSAGVSYESDAPKGPEEAAIAEEEAFIFETDAASYAETESLRNHIVFIFEIERLQEVLRDKYEERAVDQQMMTGRFDTVEQLARSVALPDIIRSGEFNLASCWADDTKTRVKLQRGSTLRGDVCVLVGDYIGAHVYAAEAILQSRGSIVTPALRALLHTHVDEAQGLDEDMDNVLKHVTVEQVEGMLGLRLTQEQRDHVLNPTQ